MAVGQGLQQARSNSLISRRQMQQTKIAGHQAMGEPAGSVVQKNSGGLMMTAPGQDDKLAPLRGQSQLETGPQKAWKRPSGAPSDTNVTHVMGDSTRNSQIQQNKINFPRHFSKVPSGKKEHENITFGTPGARIGGNRKLKGESGCRTSQSPRSHLLASHIPT